MIDTEDAGKHHASLFIYQPFHVAVQLNIAYRTVAEKLGVRFVDTTDWDIELTFDGVHYSERGHQTFAEQLWLALQ